MNELDCGCINFEGKIDLLFAQVNYRICIALWPHGRINEDPLMKAQSKTQHLGYGPTILERKFETVGKRIVLCEMFLKCVFSSYVHLCL